MPLFLPKRLATYPNEHADLISSHFAGAAADVGAIPRDMRFVFICFTNRCGSHFLAEGLASSGLLNGAGEMFNAETVIADSKAQGLRDLGQYVGFLTREFSFNNTLVSKVSVTQLALLVQTGILDSICDRSSFILLERDDKLGQAISYALALGTGGWTSGHKTRIEPGQVPFSAEIVSNFIKGLAEEIGLFHHFFAANGLAPMHVSYEMLEAIPEIMLTRIGAFLGMPGLRFVRSALLLRRQRDDVNLLWRQRFLELRDRAD